MLLNRLFITKYIIHYLLFSLAFYINIFFSYQFHKLTYLTFILNLFLIIIWIIFKFIILMVSFINFHMILHINYPIWLKIFYMIVNISYADLHKQFYLYYIHYNLFIYFILLSIFLLLFIKILFLMIVIVYSLRFSSHYCFLNFKNFYFVF
jgi:hypothetical protein